MRNIDYSKGILKDYQKAIEKIDYLTNNIKKIVNEEVSKTEIYWENKVKKIEEKHEKQIKKLKENHKKEIQKLHEKIDNLETEVNNLKKENTLLKNENDRLKGIVSKDSSNSSIPPSQDMKKPKINLREKSNKKIGAQEKHKGKTLCQEDIDNLIEKGKAIKKIEIHGNPNAKICIKKSIVDIETRVIVTEHHFYFDNKKAIKIPKEYKSNVQYGENLKTLCNLLVIEDTLSLEKVQELIKILTQDGIQISQGSIINWIKEKSKKCENNVEEIKTKLKNGEKIYTDLTSTSLNGDYAYVRNYSDEKYTLYDLASNKTIEEITRQGILNSYTGYIIHDHETSLYNFGLKEKHVECNVHLRRYLKYNQEINLENTWSKKMDDFLIRLKKEKEELIRKNKKSFSKKYLEKISKEYDEILSLGYEENENKKSKFLKKEEKALINRLKKYKKSHLLYVYDFKVPFDNNMSERDLRKVKTKKKISGCFRSEKLLKAYCQIQTIISSCKKQKLNVFDTLKNIGTNRVSL